jgi:hypothetical protein
VAAREETKRELERRLENPEAGRLLSRAEAAYERLTNDSDFLTLPSLDQRF